MTRPCALTGRKSGKGHKVSHANNKSIRRFHVNTSKELVTSDTLKQSFRLVLSTRALRSIDKKGGFDSFLLTRKRRNLAPKLQRLQRKIRTMQGIDKITVEPPAPASEDKAIVKDETTTEDQAPDQAPDQTGETPT